MNPASKSSEKTYSSFWAVCVVFLVLLVLQAAYVADDLKQRTRLNNARAQLQSALAQARTINQTTEGVGRDLIALSPNSAEAARIISEFNIKLNEK